MPLTDPQSQTIDRYWRAANYLSVGQIYLMDNPLLTEPLRPGHIKPRLLGHWGTTPGLNLIWAHLNRAIRAHDATMMIVVIGRTREAFVLRRAAEADVLLVR